MASSCRRIDDGRHGTGTTIHTSAAPAAVTITRGPSSAADGQAPDQSVETNVLSVETVLSLAQRDAEEDLAYAIAGHLGWRELAVMSQVCRFYADVVNSETLWQPQCQSYWSTKHFVPSKSRSLVAEGRHRAAFSFAVTDSKRTWLTAEELCSLSWHGRMKEAAGEHFTDSDPWWTGATPKPPSKYHMDGTTMRYVQAEREGDPPVETRSGEWRFVKRSCGQTGPVGSFVRMKHRALGRETPTKIVARHANWGWLLDGCWSISASFPLPPKGEDLSLEDAALPVTVESQQEEAMAYNYGLPLPDDRVEGGATGGEEGGASGGGDGDEDTQMVTIDLSGREVSLPMHVLIEMVRQNQLQHGDEDDSGDDGEDSDGSSDDSSDDSAPDDSAEEQEEQEDVDLDSDDESNAGGTAALPDGTESENQPAAAAVKATPTTPARPRAEEGGC